MAKVKTGILELPLEEALSFIKNADGKVRFQLMVHAFLPTKETLGFPGQTCITVSRSAMIEAVENMGRTLCTHRGAKVRLHCTGAESKDDLSFIAVY